MRLHEKVCIITGAASGIGRASALLFAREGARLAISDVDSAGLARVAGEIARAGGDALEVVCDVGQASANEDLVARTIARYGRLDVVFGNAGIGPSKGILDTSEELFDRVMDVNVKALFRLCRAALPTMVRQRSGVILFTASKVGLVAQRDSPLYNASKGAVVLLAKSLALDFAPYAIRVNAICPGIIDTKLLDDFIAGLPDPVAARREFSVAQPLGRLGAPEECAEAALFLCSDAASFITGVALPIDGGFTAQ